MRSVVGHAIEEYREWTHIILEYNILILMLDRFICYQPNQGACA